MKSKGRWTADRGKTERSGENRERSDGCLVCLRVCVEERVGMGGHAHRLGVRGL